MKVINKLKSTSKTLQQLKEALLSKQGYVVVAYPYHSFLYWARKLTYEVLGKPTVRDKYKWTYNDKVVCFVLVNRPCDEHRLRGIAREQILLFDGHVVDELLGGQ